MYSDFELFFTVAVAMAAAFVTGLLLGSAWGASTIRGILAAAG
jgi:hypothetical protein